MRKREWLNEEEFLEALEIALALPGPNVVNLVTMLGRLLRGPWGAAAAFTGLILPAIFANAVIVALILPQTNRPEFLGILAGLSAAATGLAIANAGQMVHLHLRNIPDIVITLAAVVFVLVLKPPLVASIVIFGGIGIALHYFRRVRG